MDMRSIKLGRAARSRTSGNGFGTGKRNRVLRRGIGTSKMERVHNELMRR